MGICYDAFVIDKYTRTHLSLNPLNDTEGINLDGMDSYNGLRGLTIDLAEITVTVRLCPSFAPEQD